MRRNRTIASMLAAVVTLGGLGVVGATSAAAVDDGPRQSGSVYFLNNQKNLATASAADQVTGGSFEGRAFTSVAVDGKCPAGTVQAQVYTRLRTTQPEDFWDEVPMGGTRPYAEDAQGNAYVVTAFDNFNLAMIQNHLGGTTQDLPVAFVCKDNMGVPLGHFQTEVTVGAGASGTWSQINPTLITGGGQQAADTTLTLSGVAAGANLALTAAVNPESAAGTVTFAEGAVQLGTETVVGGRATLTVVAPTDGDHTYTATFTPSDPSEFNGSAIQATFSVAVQPDGSIVVTLVVPGGETGEPGTVTLTVPEAVRIALIGERTAGNHRVTATGDLPEIMVTDTRRSDLLTAWQVNVQATDFTNGSATIAAKYLGLVPAEPSTTPLVGPPTNVRRGATVVSAMDESTSAGMSQNQPLGTVETPGQGTTTLGGVLNLAVPGASAAEGTYSSVLTVTLVNG
ncbi:MAG: Ig-like domain-containing protein [Micrococcales bacterium]|nr:Ig-like domain-containing protein [Micrococcales bacterium]